MTAVEMGLIAEPECRRRLIVVYHNNFSVNCLAQNYARLNTKFNGLNTKFARQFVMGARC